MKKIVLLFIVLAIFALTLYSNLGYIPTKFLNIQTNNTKSNSASLLNKIEIQRIIATINNYRRINSTNLNIIHSTNNINTSKIPCNLIWRYDFKCALKYALSKRNLNGVEYIAKKLKGNDTQQDVWNILDWEGEHIKYNWSKARLLPTVVEWNGRQLKIVRKGNWYQTPEETIAKGNGICGDYAILTSALLLDMNVTPYAVVVHFKNTSVSHAAVAVKIRGWFFILDQHLPPMDLGAYYREWAYYRKNFGLKRISTMHFYKIKKENNRIKIVDLGIITGKEMMKQNYNINKDDEKAIAYSLMNIISNKYGVSIDPNLKDLKPKSYLPAGYTSGRYWTFKFPHYADYYNPIFFKQYVSYLFKQISNKAVAQDISGSNRIWINIGANNSDLILHIIVATYS